MIVAAEGEAELAAGTLDVRRQIAFYGSTPAYRPVLELHGWGKLQDELSAMSLRGEWDGMAALIDDDVLHTFAVIGTPAQAAAELHRRYGDIVTRLTIPIAPGGDDATRRQLRDALRAGPALT